MDPSDAALASAGGTAQDRRLGLGQLLRCEICYLTREVEAGLAPLS